MRPCFNPLPAFRPGETDLSAFGLQLEGDPEPELEIWPENLQTVEVFVALDTQWQVHGFSGARIGLRYEAVPVCLELMGVGDRADVFEGLRTMERAALEVFAGQAAEESRRVSPVRGRAR